MHDPSLLRRATAFHGHLGPWLVLGLRAGRHAARALDADPFRLRALVRCPARTPYSCFIDGVQLGSGCTMGKRNVRHIRAGRVSVEFQRMVSTAPGLMSARSDTVSAAMRLELQPELWTELHMGSAPSRAETARLGRLLYRRPLHRLFLITRS